MATPLSRNVFLDCLKGFAISTVVLGHTFQGATPDFDHYLPFRLVYSFHMPMFMFVSGMTSSMSFLRRLQSPTNLLPYLVDLRSKSLRLVVPFTTWAVLQYFWLQPTGFGLATWLLHVLKYPDNGLWFLWILFLSSCILTLLNAGIEHAYHFATRSGGRNNSAVLYLLLILAWPVASELLRALPPDPGLVMIKIYFPYFFAGFVFQIVRPDGLPLVVRWCPYALFIVLAPFWYRTEISPLAALFAKPAAVNIEYQKIVALAGTLAFVDFARLFTNSAPTFLARAVAFVGRRSLDIYAIHFYVLGYLPRVIAPIVISLGISFILRTNPITSWLCLGQKPLKVWQTVRYRVSAYRNRTTTNAISAE